MPDTAPPPFDTETEPAIAAPAVAPVVVFLGGLFLLAALAACYLAAEIVLPVALAFVLSLVFQPVLRWLERLRLPRVVASLVIVLLLVAAVGFLGLLLSAPIADWIAQLPHTLPRLQARLKFLGAPIRSLQEALAHIEHMAPVTNQPAIAVESSNLPQQLLVHVRLVASSAFTTVLVLFFVLVSGEEFLRRLVELLPGFGKKRQVVEISKQIEQDVSIYLATITMMNFVVGVATGVMAWLCGLGDPLLWGTVAFLLNYVPILGPTAGVLVFVVAGLIAIDPLWAAFVPAALYLLIHIAEGETVTPMLLAARFTINPVAIVLGVIFWYWMWGVCGALLATPMLAIIKIVCDRVEGLKPFGHFIGGEPATPANGKAAH